MYRCKKHTKLNYNSLIIMIILALIGLSGTSLADSHPDVMTSENLAKLKYVYEAAISPDGNNIAYIQVVPRNPFTEDNGSVWKELYIVDLKGHSRPYITGEITASQIKWSPDGRNISYLAERNGDDEKSLYMIPFGGGESRKLIEFQTGIKEYTWSPDSRHVAFLAKDTISEDREKLEELGFDAKIYEEDWRHVKVWIYDIADESTPPRSLDLSGSASTLSWSPDGKLLALALAPTPLIDDRYTARKICLVDPKTGELVKKYDNIGKLGQIKWSPDSKNLAAILAEDINDPKEGELYICPTDGDKTQPLITGINGHISKIVWKDKKTILFLLDQNVHSSIETIRINGKKRKTILSPGRPIFSNISLSDNGKILALLGSNYNHPTELFYIDTKNQKRKRLTESNFWMKGIRFAKQEVINFKARDGLELQGILIHPLDEVAGQRFPMIMSVHGGPEAHRRDNWLTWSSGPGQIAAAQGFAVFYPNYRGSTGRGVEFSKMGQADYAGGEFNDLVDAIDHLVNMGLVDRDKVGITGGSYGGYASAWAATALSEHFAASVMSVGVSDLISKFGTTDIPMEMYYVHARSWPWEKWQWYMERSPIYHAEKSRTPILILHGEDDTRVHPSQSMELYRYLKTLGNAPVRLVFYPDEGHGNSKAAARYDYNLRMMRWMEHYLKGPGGEPPAFELDYSKLNLEKE
jgi:dipeptidyl aminopeptidase/acylaminoacyl peptidase